MPQPKSAPKRKSAPESKSASARRPDGKARLLSGGNPQISKGDGDAPVQAYIDAIPDWKREIVRQIDRIITREIPGVQKAVKWNSPFYGSLPSEGRGWFLSLHCFNKYVKVAFFAGTSLKPMPPRESKSPGVRYLDVTESGFDARQFADWVRQAEALPGWIMK
jgi:hypothetical protein